MQPLPIDASVIGVPPVPESDRGEGVVRGLPEGAGLVLPGMPDGSESGVQGEEPGGTEREAEGVRGDCEGTQTPAGGTQEPVSPEFWTVCRSCKQLKRREEFSLRRELRSGYRKTCKECENAQKRIVREQSREPRPPREVVKPKWMERDDGRRLAEHRLMMEPIEETHRTKGGKTCGLEKRCKKCRLCLGLEMFFKDCRKHYGVRDVCKACEALARWRREQ